MVSNIIRKLMNLPHLKNQSRNKPAEIGQLDLNTSEQRIVVWSLVRCSYDPYLHLVSAVNISLFVSAEVDYNSFNGHAWAAPCVIGYSINIEQEVVGEFFPKCLLNHMLIPVTGRGPAEVG